MADNIWRGQEAVVTLKSDGTEKTVGIIQDVEISPSRTIEQLRGAGSREFQDLQQTEFEVDVSSEVLKWSTAAYESLIDYDDANDKISDSSDVPTFSIIGDFKNTDGDEYSLTVESVYFEDLPLSGDPDSWVGLDLDGIGKNLSKTYTSA